MVTLSDLVTRYFPQEKAIRLINAELLKEKQSIFGIPMSYFKSIKPITEPKIEIIETANYWLLDLRYKTTIWERLLNFFSIVISIVIFIVFFGKIALTIPLYILIPAIMLFIIYAIFEYYLIINQGFGTYVYKKEWVVVNESSKTMEMEVNLPKYSRSRLTDYKFGSKFLDFLGITISSGSININYSFKLP